MISTVTLTFDLTYVDPLTNTVVPRGIVTDSTNYSGPGGIGIDLNINQAKGVGVITFNGDVIVDLNDPSSNDTTMINLQDWESQHSGETPYFAFNLPLDVNGNVANGVYTLLYRLRLTGLCDFQSITLPSTAVSDSFQFAGFLEAGNSLTMDPSGDPVVIVSVGEVSGGEFPITLSGLQNDTDSSSSFDITNVQLNGVYTYSGCVQSAADVTFSYDCEVGTNGTWAVANSTVLNGQTITSLSAAINYPAWTSLTPTFNSQIITNTLPYSNNVLATGTFSVSLSQTIQKVQTDGLILQYISSGSQEFVVSCAGSLCGLIPCIESLRNAHATELQRNRISKYQVFVDNVLLYYTLAQNYRSCGDIENYRRTLALIEGQLDASGCECGCCDPDTYQWVNNNAASTIDTLINAIQFRLFNADPVGPGSPLSTNDVTQGVQVGALWENVETQVIYICLTNGQGTATWEEYYGPGQIPTASEIPATPSAILTSGFVQGQLDQVDALAVFDGINGLNKVGNDVRLGGTLDGVTLIDVDGNDFIIQSDDTSLEVIATAGVPLLCNVNQNSSALGTNLVLQTLNSSGVGANGIGSSIQFSAATASGSAAPTSNIKSTWVNATTQSSNLQITTKNSGVENPAITLNFDGSVTLNEYGQTPAAFSGAPQYLLGVDNNGLVTETVSAIYSMAVIRITQSGSGAPTLVQTVYNNTGATFSFQYGGVGQYRLSLGSLINDLKTSVVINNGNAGSRVGFVYAEPVSAGYVAIRTYDYDTATLQDGILNNATVEIKIFA